MIRLLLAIPALDRGGPDRVLFDVARKIDRDRFEPHVLVTDPGGYYLGELPSDVGVHLTSTTGIRIVDRYPVRGFRHAVARTEPDVVMTTLRMNLTAGVSSLLPRSHAWVTRVPNHVSATEGDTSLSTKWKSWGYHQVMKRTMSRADVIVAQSSEMAHDLVQLGYAPDHIRTIGNPIEEAWVAARRAEGGSVEMAGDARLLAVGRIEVQKGFDVLVESMPDVLRARSGAHLTVLGDGLQRPSLEARAAELGVSHAVTFAGAVPNPFPYYAAADVVVAPSRWEGLSNVVLEALASGCPVVGTDGPSAIQDLVTPPLDGLLVPQEDPAALAAAVVSVLADAPDRRAIAERCHARFGADHIVEAYADMLEEAVARRSVGGRRSTTIAGGRR